MLTTCLARTCCVWLWKWGEFSRNVAFIPRHISQLLVLSAGECALSVAVSNLALCVHICITYIMPKRYVYVINREGERFMTWYVPYEAWCRSLKNAITCTYVLRFAFLQLPCGFDYLLAPLLIHPRKMTQIHIHVHVHNILCKVHKDRHLYSFTTRSLLCTYNLLAHYIIHTCI